MKVRFMGKIVDVTKGLLKFNNVGQSYVKKDAESLAKELEEDKNNPELKHLLKLAEYNKKVVETFDIVEDQRLADLPQYFIMYCMEEGEYFSSERIVGYRDASEVAGAMAYYRETGILRYPKPFVHPLSDEDRYEYVQPIAIYVLNTEAIMHKVLNFKHREELD
jgi:hypothetical protein